MLNKKMNARKMVLILKENNAFKMPFLLSLNDYTILKEASRVNPQIQIFKDCVDSFDKIGLYNKNHLDIFKKAVLSKVKDGCSRVNCFSKDGLTVLVNTEGLCSRSALSGDGNNIKGLSGMFLLLPGLYVQ